MLGLAINEAWIVDWGAKEEEGPWVPILVPAAVHFYASVSQLIKRLVGRDPAINTALPYPHWGGILQPPRSNTLGNQVHLRNGLDPSLPKG